MSHVWTNRKLSSNDFAIKVQKFTPKERDAVVTININNNAVSELPEELAQMPQLKTLYLMDNNLTFVPSWLGSITRLTLLALDRNLIALLPRDIASLVNLEILTLSKNKLATLPSLRSLRCLKQIDLRDNLLPASISVSIVNDIRKVQALLETIDMVCEDKAALPSAPPLSSPRSMERPERAAPPPPRSAPVSLSRADSSLSGHMLYPEDLHTVEDVQAYFQQLGASDEALQLLRAEHVDGAALALFSPAELRENFKVSLGVLKKHTDNLERSKSNTNADDQSQQERDAEDARRRAERERDEVKRQADRAVEQAERDAEEARRKADRDAVSLDYEHRRRVQAERELEDARRKLEREEVERRARVAEDERRRKDEAERERRARQAREEEERRANRPPVSPRSSPPPSSPRTGVKCKTCHREMLPGESYIKKKGRTYCQEHGYEKCKGCRGPLTGTYIKYKESTYHNTCFKCSTCGSTLGTTFYSHKTTGRPVCYGCSN